MQVVKRGGPVVHHVLSIETRCDLHNGIELSVRTVRLLLVFSYSDYIYVDKQSNFACRWSPVHVVRKSIFIHTVHPWPVSLVLILIKINLFLLSVADLSFVDVEYLMLLHWTWFPSFMAILVDFMQSLCGLTLYRLLDKSSYLCWYSWPPPRRVTSLVFLLISHYLTKSNTLSVSLVGSIWRMCLIYRARLLWL